MDNVGAIFISENNTATSRTKHIDVRYHYVREFIEDGFIKKIFVRSADKKSDMFTKNISSDVYESHINDFVIKKGKVNSDREIEGRVLEGHNVVGNVDEHKVVSIPDPHHSDQVLVLLVLIQVIGYIGIYPMPSY